jgi:SAM-dependent methyltransferase
LRALSYAADVLPAGVSRYQIDLMRLEWRERWDVAFLLDVLEHIPEDEEALRQIHAALTPGGLLFVTTPALQRFWTYNDELAHHVRRYSRADFQRLAATCGFQCLDTRYFMFFLSPLLLASRLLGRVDVARMTEADRRALLARTHRVPNTAVNTALAAVFGAETPLGHRLSFPWGTSVLAVLRKAGG